MTTLTQGPYSVRYKESWLQHKGEEESGIEEKNNLVNLWKRKQLRMAAPVYRRSPSLRKKSRERGRLYTG